MNWLEEQLCSALPLIVLWLLNKSICVAVYCVCACAVSCCQGYIIGSTSDSQDHWQSREFGRPKAADWCFILCLCSAGLGSVMRSRNPSLVLLKRVAEELAPQVGSLFSFLLTKGFKIRPIGPCCTFLLY